MVNGCAIDDDIQASKMSINCFDPLKDRFGIAHIALQGETFIVLPCQISSDSLGGLSIDINADNVAASRRKSSGGCLA